MFRVQGFSLSSPEKGLDVRFPRLCGLATHSLANRRGAKEGLRARVGALLSVWVALDAGPYALNTGSGSV